MSVRRLLGMVSGDMWRRLVSTGGCAVACHTGAARLTTTCIRPFHTNTARLTNSCIRPCHTGTARPETSCIRLFHTTIARLMTSCIRPCHTGTARLTTSCIPPCHTNTTRPATSCVRFFHTNTARLMTYCIRPCHTGTARLTTSCIHCFHTYLARLTSSHAPTLSPHSLQHASLPHPTAVHQTSAKPSKKRKRPVLADDVQRPLPVEQQDLKVVAYSTAEEYDLEKLLVALLEQNVFQPSPLSEDVHDVLHAIVCGGSDDGFPPPEMFVFREGTVVFWNVTQSQRSDLLQLLGPCGENAYDSDTVDDQSEVMPYAFTCGSGVTRLSAGRILLSSGGSASAAALERYAFSNAVSLSVKLGVWETALERYTDRIRPVTEQLQRGGTIHMRKQQMLRLNGQLFGLRHVINLGSDCLDTPDFYWDRENLEALYQHTCNYLNISKRTRVMNEKLNHCLELADMLTSSLQDKHHVRLEWMIIALIMLEVGFEIVHFVERYT